MQFRRVVLAALTLGAAALVVAPSSPASAGPNLTPKLLTGTGNGTVPHVKMWDGASEVGGFLAHSNNTGVRVAAGDLNGDGQVEIITAEGPGAPSRVTARSLDQTFNSTFQPYDGFKGGVNIAAGDVDGDGVDELVTAADSGGGPHVIVWDLDGSGHFVAKVGWFAYDPGFKGGVRVAVGNVVGSTKADIVTAPGPGGGPHVRVWDLGSGSPAEAAGWFAYAPSFTGGVSVAAGEMDGAKAVVTGAGPGGGSHVRVFSPSGTVKHEFMAYAPSFYGGVNVALALPTGGDLGYIYTAPASWGGPHVRALRSSGAPIFEFMAYGSNPINGVTLAAVPQLGNQNGTNQNSSNQNGTTTS